MKVKLKFFLTLISMVLLVNFLFPQSPKKTLNQIDSNIKTQSKVEPPQSIDAKFQEQIIELKKQIVQLTQTVADTKQTFYDSKLDYWNFILAAFGLLVIIAGYFGYKSIFDKIIEIKTDGEKAITKSEEAVKDIKNDLLQRITDVKEDIREFKKEQRLIFEKFEKDANIKIDKGLDLALQEAIKKIMEGSFNNKLNELSEQLSDLRNTFENLSKLDNAIPSLPSKIEVNEFDGDLNKPTLNKNAFDE